MAYDKGIRARIFEFEGAVVTYALFREQPHELYLRQFFVQRHRRGSQLGRQAMQLLLDGIWSTNKRRRVELLSDNAPVLAFYRTLGFADYSVMMEILPAEPAS